MCRNIKMLFNFERLAVRHRKNISAMLHREEVMGLKEPSVA